MPQIHRHTEMSTVLIASGQSFGADHPSSRLHGVAGLHLKPCLRISPLRPRPRFWTYSRSGAVDPHVHPPRVLCVVSHLGQAADYGPFALCLRQ